MGRHQVRGLVFALGLGLLLGSLWPLASHAGELPPIKLKRPYAQQALKPALPPLQLRRPSSLRYSDLPSGLPRWTPRPPSVPPMTPTEPPAAPLPLPTPATAPTAAVPTTPPLPTPMTPADLNQFPRLADSSLPSELPAKLITLVISHDSQSLSDQAITQLVDLGESLANQPQLLLEIRALVPLGADRQARQAAWQHAQLIRAGLVSAGLSPYRLNSFVTHTTPAPAPRQVEIHRLR